MGTVHNISRYQSVMQFRAAFCEVLIWGGEGEGNMYLFPPQNAQVQVVSLAPCFRLLDTVELVAKSSPPCTVGTSDFDAQMSNIKI
jgi:hypothetical protein